MVTSRLVAGWWLAVGAFAACMAAAAPQGEEALKGLEGHLAEMRGIKTLAVRFICEKRLAMLDSPLVSSGRLWIRKDEKGAGALRFSTERPYVSELVLAEGKVFGRSQHEKEWTVQNQNARPGLTAVMLQLGGWSTGEAGKLTEFYQVERGAPGAAVPTAPQGSARGGGEVRSGKEGLDFFELIPTNKDLAAAVKNIELAIDQRDHALVSIEITTVGGDVTRYWFYGVEKNVELAGEVFKPVEVPGAASGNAGVKGGGGP